MSGIAGFAGYGTRSDLDRMMEPVARRGSAPPRCWHLPDRSVYLGWCGHEPADNAALPTWSADGQIGAMLDGSIRNRAELTAELERCRPGTPPPRSDAELLVEGWKEWGDALPDRLDGGWSFVIVDRIRSVLYIARDRFGQKPLYYSRQKGVFAFASTLAGVIRHPRIAARIHETGVQKYFAYGFIPAPHTPYEHVYKLPAACSMVFSTADHELSVSRYWAFRLEPEASGPQHDAARLDQLRSLLAAGTLSCRDSHDAAGVLLDGSDGSVALAAAGIQGVAPDTVRTFSFRIGTDAAWSRADDVARQLATAHHAGSVAVDDVPARIPGIFGGADEPVGSSAFLPLHLLCGHARRTVAVALASAGADELFATSPTASFQRFAARYLAAVPGPLHPFVHWMSWRMPWTIGNPGRAADVHRCLRALGHRQALWNPIWMSPLAPSALAAMFGWRLSLDEVFSEAIALWDDMHGTPAADRTLVYFVRLQLENGTLPMWDRASAAHGLDLQLPFLDRAVVDLARRLPARLRAPGRAGSPLLQQASGFLHGGPARPMGAADRDGHVAQWFRERRLALPPSSAQAFSQPEFAPQRLEAHRGGGADYSAFLWRHLAWSLTLDAGTGLTDAAPDRVRRIA